MSADPTRTSSCKSCGRLVRWAVTPAGKWMPVDAEPDNRPTGGNLVLAVRRRTELIAETWERDKHGLTRNRYTAHWATCPNADSRRKRAG